MSTPQTYWHLSRQACDGCAFCLHHHKFLFRRKAKMRFWAKIRCIHNSQPPHCLCQGLPCESQVYSLLQDTTMLCLYSSPCSFFFTSIPPHPQTHTHTYRYMCGCFPVSPLLFSVGLTPLTVPPPSSKPLSNLGAVCWPIIVIRPGNHVLAMMEKYNKMGNDLKFILLRKGFHKCAIS